MHFSVFCALALLPTALGHFIATKADFDYDPNSPHGPAHWAGECNVGTKQSPIDIMLQDVVSKELPNIEMTNTYNVLPESISVINNGHTIQVTATLDRPISISGGPLNGTYNLLQFHFHWGSDDKHGSEHKISGSAYPMEMHAVHRNDEPRPNENPLSVIGYFLKVSSKGNPAISKILAALESDPTENVEIPVEPFKLNELIKPFNKYLTYSGSLTTPPCTETVQWVIAFSNILSISQSQMDKFREIATEVPTLKNNYRPVQPINGRRLLVKLF